MVKHMSLFGQLVALFDRQKFYRLVFHHQTERFSKKFNTWDHFVAMLFCQIGQAKSLREICCGMASCMGKLKHLGMKRAPNKSTLAYANTHRSWEFFQDLFYDTLGWCKTAAPGKKKFRFKNKLLSLDSSTISLCLSLFPWAKFRRTKGAVKLHLLLDHDGYLPSYVYISNGKKADVKVAKHISLSAGSIVAMDRGYNDYRLFADWTENGIFFVTRLKDNASYIVVENRNVPQNRNILSDQLIRFAGSQASRHCDSVMRRVVVLDTENEREIVLLTNHLEFGATTISAIYKDRWQIELFFKALKQNLKVKTFVGTTENALYIQIWTALIAMLLVRFLQFKSRFAWSMSNLIALLRWNLFSYRSLWDWIDSPFDVLPMEPPPVQFAFPFRFIGQHPK